MMHHPPPPRHTRTSSTTILKHFILLVLLGTATLLVHAATAASTTSWRAPWSSHQRTVKRLLKLPLADCLRGGASFIEVNPDYVSPNAAAGGSRGDSRYYTQQHPASRISPGGSTSPLLFAPSSRDDHPSHSPLSVLDRWIAYAKNLRRSSPALLGTSLACVLVFVAWHTLPRRSVQVLLQRHFVTSEANFRKGRYLSLLLSSVSHTTFLHLALNLYAFLSFGPVLKTALRTSLVGLILGSALSGSLTYLLISRHKHGCIGLSSVVFAFLAVFARLFPSNVIGFYVAGIIPLRMAAEQWLQTMIAWSTALTLIPIGTTAHAAHLGGILFGLLYVEYWKRSKFGHSTTRGPAFVPLY